MSYGSELQEARDLASRYRNALQNIVMEDGDRPWCPMYAECDHEGCKASARHIEVATNALNVKESF